MCDSTHTCSKAGCIILFSLVQLLLLLDLARQHVTKKNAVAFLAQKPLQEPVSHEPKGPHKSNREECRFSLLFIISMCVFTRWS